MNPTSFSIGDISIVVMPKSYKRFAGQNNINANYMTFKAFAFGTNIFYSNAVRFVKVVYPAGGRHIGHSKMHR